MAVTVAEVAAVLGVDPPRHGGSAVVTDLVIDSRVVRAGSLFVALAGERVDGHSFVPGALASGAVAAVTERALPDAGGPCLVVEDAVAALGRVSRHGVDRALAAGLAVLAITGSQGKTSTKDLLAQILEQSGPTVAPYGNLNNEVGVPLTASRIDQDTRYLVVEMGARGVGHIAYLCRVTPPQIGVVLNVGHAHVGEFGSQQAIARAKGELVEALGDQGAAVLNADDPLVWAMRQRTRAATWAFSVLAEPATDLAVWASDVTGDELGRYRFTLHAKDAGSRAQSQVDLGLSGRHHVPNAVAAAAAAVAVGVDLELVSAGLSRAELRSGSRMELHQRPDGVVVINDAYNANPESGRAAVDTLAEIGRARGTRGEPASTWAVLGDMLELGATAPDEHAALGRHLAEAGVDQLVAVGDFAADLARGAAAGGLPSDRLVVLDRKATAAQHVLARLQPGDTVLVKASRGLALDTVAEEIWTSAAPRPEGDAPGGPPSPDSADSAEGADSAECADSKDPA